MARHRSASERKSISWFASDVTAAISQKIITWHTLRNWLSEVQIWKRNLQITFPMHHSRLASIICELVFRDRYLKSPWPFWLWWHTDRFDCWRFAMISIGNNMGDSPLRNLPSTVPISLTKSKLRQISQSKERRSASRQGVSIPEQRHQKTKLIPINRPDNEDNSVSQFSATWTNISA